MNSIAHNCIRLNLLSSALLFCAGCNSVPAQPVVYVPSPRVWLAPGCRESVWLPDQVSAYAVGRYVDPRDPNLVHEAHTLYRREISSRPNLASASSTKSPLIFSASGTNDTTLLRDALTAELNRQRATSQALVEQAKLLDQGVRRLSAQTLQVQEELAEANRFRSQALAGSNRVEGAASPFVEASPLPLKARSYSITNAPIIRP